MLEPVNFFLIQRWATCRCRYEQLHWNGNTELLNFSTTWLRDKNNGKWQKEKYRNIKMKGAIGWQTLCLCQYDKTYTHFKILIVWHVGWDSCSRISSSTSKLVFLCLRQIAIWNSSVTTTKLQGSYEICETYPFWKVWSGSKWCITQTQASSAHENKTGNRNTHRKTGATEEGKKWFYCFSLGLMGS